ncbi:MAG: GGDEF domain-containing protein [Desulfuromonadaceae bacterium]|nr:GGDEF domain-containing protein [Desulfuromonadaceae bacterium]
MKLVDLLERMPRSGITAVALSLCVVVGVLDGTTGSDYSLVPFYFVPVVLAAWFVGRKAGYLLSLAGALAWLLAEMVGRERYHFEFALLWNDLMELLLFLLSALVVSSLKGALERENGMARTDQLTGISNRRHYLELVTGEMRRNHRYKEPFTVAYLDIDKFKTINDAMGHAEGDKLLRQVANVIVSAIRETDTVARLGGDEFALLLPNTAEESALTVAAKVRQQLKKDVESCWPITFSMGLVTYMKSPATIDEVIGRADRLMYEVKEESKDALRYEVVGELPQ